MGRPTARIQSQIDALEAQLATTPRQSMASDGTSVSNPDYDKLNDRLDQLYIQLGRADGSSPRMVRGRLDGMGV